MVLWSFFCTAGLTDIHSYVDVAPLMASAGYRAIVPYLRAMARRAFSRAKRSGMPNSRPFALDIIALMDALQVKKAIVAGFDWGITDGRRPRGALAGTVQGARRRERLSGHQPQGKPAAFAASG